MAQSQKPPKFLNSSPPEHRPHVALSYPGKHILQLTLNRPKALNAMTQELRDDIEKIMDWFESENSLWVVIITGTGRAFCAGMDLKNWLQNQKDGERGEAETMANDTTGFGSLARRRCIKPIIAAVNGIAMGGGVEILLNCDLVVASRDAKLGLPEVKRGVVAAAGGTSVTSVVPPSQVLSTAVGLAKEIVANSPDAVWSTKKALLEGQKYASLEEAVIEHNLSEVSKKVYQGDNIREGLLAFSEASGIICFSCAFYDFGEQKRKPKWTNPKL
ncbi:hypothetical protein FRC10_008757 [Ceratobasidium sp. 414]|nr:hypothetical protein FRC10_008757 [Ceratobasidium sp. 414]